MKTDILNYFIEANLILLLSGGLYYAILHSQHTFRLKRHFVLLSTLSALLVPLIRINDSVANTARIASTIPTIILESLTLEPNTTTTFNWISVIDYSLPIYLVISSIIFGSFLYQLLELWKIKNIKSNTVYKHQGCTIITTNESYPTFSFFKWIFLNKEETQNEEDREQIITHELVHAQQYHSVDMILLIMTRTIFWINPVPWFYKRSQQETHEYLVDHEVLKTNQKADYQSLLARITVNRHYSTGNYFAQNQTIKRINIMNEKPKKHQFTRSLLASLAMLALVSFLACNDDVVNILETAEQAIEIPSAAQTQLDELRREYPNEIFNYIELDMSNDGIAENSIATLNNIQYMNIDKIRKKAEVIVAAGDDFEQLVEYRKTGDVYDIVEKQPEPEEGMTSFYEYVGQNMQYPEEAKSAGIEGRVFVQFIVDKEGQLTEVTAIKGIGYGCDEEAIRVIKEADNWTPGKQKGQAVKVKMILPISFKL